VRVLVTGSEGYVGALLPGVLTERGHEVVGVDTGFYKAGWLYNAPGRTASTLNEDIRRLQPRDLSGVQAVVHLAELSNDPIGALAPRITHEINHGGSLHLARLAKAAGVRRFVYMSSCSVYGVATEESVSEDSALRPQTPYAVCKTLVERDVAAMGDGDFSPTFLRSATAYGASPRMRFDIVLNNLCGLARTTGKITMESDGTPWRPFIHVRDMCKAVACTLEAPVELVHNRAFNIGPEGGNRRIRDVAEIVAGVFQGCKVTFAPGGGPDTRTYRVSFARAAKELPGFSCDWDLERGARELRDLFDQVDLSEETFRFRGFTRLKQIEYLLRTGQIDESFYWRPCAS
jgi:nucleoside-diphosphate-sugar epimerase